MNSISFSNNFCYHEQSNGLDTPTFYRYYYNEPNSNDQQQYEEYFGEMEEQHHTQYDTDMVNAVAEAGFQDYYYYCLEQLKLQQNQDEYMSDADDIYEQDYNIPYGLQHTSEMQQGQEAACQSNSLLNLVVDVQTYLTEQADYYNHLPMHESPLYNLQYKMYTYLRQKSLESTSEN
ncbi:MAG: hypothetical protein EXX96DRAFT_554629 [Benjaminiella poitrasii]|nr:MAG: hypothetical protein EXX96DRAFT_554629 [Benjaminiella poitrasii]